MPKRIRRQQKEILDIIKTGDGKSPDLKEILTDVEEISSKERKYAMYRLPIARMLVVVGIMVGIMIFTSYSTGILKAKNQSSFWLDAGEEYAEFQVKEDEYLKMKIDVNGDELHLHPEEVSFTKKTDESIHKKKFDVVMLEK